MHISQNQLNRNTCTTHFHAQNIYFLDEKLPILLIFQIAVYECN